MYISYPAKVYSVLEIKHVFLSYSNCQISQRLRQRVCLRLKEYFLIKSLKGRDTLILKHPSRKKLYSINVTWDILSSYLQRVEKSQSLKAKLLLQVS